MYFEYFEESELILIWGVNLIVLSLYFWICVQEVKCCGVCFVVIDLYCLLIVEKCYQYIVLKFGIDGVFVFGMMYVLIIENLFDYDYIVDYMFGFDELKVCVLIYLLECVVQICGIDVLELVDFVCCYGVICKVLICFNYGM